MSYLPTPDRRVPVGTAIVLREGGPGSAFVVLRRTGAHGEGTWSLPGGWVEKGEDPLDAAIREAWEEVGVDADPGWVSFLGYTADKHPEGLFALTLWFEVDGGHWTGRPRPTHPDRVTDVRIVMLKDVPAPRFLSFENGVEKGFVK